METPRTAVTIFWKCLHCKAGGDTNGKESGDDVRHVKATGHSTVSTTKPTMLVPSPQED